MTPSIILILAIAAVIGYLAQITGLCMVRGVGDWLRGNDFQLLLALPALSPAGFSALLGMLLGIRAGKYLLHRQRERMVRAAAGL